jgi:invasion protein IalB
VKFRAKNILLAAVVACGSIGLGHAQQAPAPKAKAAPPRTAQGVPATPAPAAAAEQPAAPAAAAPPPGWAVRCASASRDAPLECAMEQNAVLSKTGQTVVSVNIRVPSDTHTPEILVQLPLGFSLPGGARFQVDDGKATEMELRTCENRGCYASAALAPDVIAALKAGKQMKVSFQTLNKEAINIPLPLTDFATAYDKIK